jgi:hypothetical protein
VGQAGETREWTVWDVTTWEYESGWGRREMGTRTFTAYENAVAFRDTVNKDLGKGEAPDTYFKAGDPVARIIRAPVGRPGEMRAKPSTNGVTMNGVERIAAERRRQRAVEGWTPDHDAAVHDDGALAVCASIYAMPPEKRRVHLSMIPVDWPDNCCEWKPGERIRELEKAGALIAAEIDRLLYERGPVGREET